MGSPRHVLVVDDDPAIRRGILRLLEAQGLRVTAVADGPAMWRVLGTGRVDLVLLDVMLPGANGLELLRTIREEQRAPVLMLSALGAEADRVVGLELGAEDYVCKPFSARELLARVRVVLRRDEGGRGRQAGGQGAYVFRGWRFDARARTLASPRGAHVELTTGEFELLLAFVENPNRVLSRDALLDLARGRSVVAIDRAIDVQVMRLRRKLETDPGSPTLIRTVRNGGYIFAGEVGRDATA
jgi:two-component system OmpR family response regulator